MSSNSVESDSREVISVLVVDDHPAICEALRHLISSEEDLVLNGTAHSTDEALTSLRSDHADVVIVNLSLRDSYGLDLVTQLQEDHPETRSIVFSMFDERIYAERAIRAGAMGYLMKTEPTAKLLEAIHSAVDGVVYVSPRMTRRILQRLPEHQNVSSGSPLDSLSDRELAVFHMVAEGKSVDQIADHLDLARKTVETYRRAARRKLGLESIEDLIRYATTWLFRVSEDKNSGPDV